MRRYLIILLVFSLILILSKKVDSAGIHINGTSFQRGMAMDSEGNVYPTDQIIVEVFAEEPTTTTITTITTETLEERFKKAWESRVEFISVTFQLLITAALFLFVVKTIESIMSR